MPAKLSSWVLQFGHGGGGWLSGEPALQALVEALDLALGMAGMAVLLRNAEVGEQVFRSRCGRR
jgi:hypothetical protein